MPKFVYVSPLIADKAHVVRYVYHQKRDNPQLVGDETSYQREMGIENFQAWLQKTDRGMFFVHYVETDQLENLSSRLKALIKKGDSKALWLRDFYLEVLGRDYTDPSAMPTLMPLVDLEVPDSLLDRGEIISQGYLLPLLPKKINAYREFCRQINGEHKGRLQEACRQFHITKWMSFLQKSFAHDYMVIYREKVLLPQEQAKRPHEARASSPAYQWLSNQLIDLSGLPFDALEPKIEYLTSQPLVTLRQRAALEELALR